MRLRGRCDTIRVGVVGCGLFATPNSLKSHKRQKELPHLCNTRAITPKLCMPSRPIHPSKNYPALKSRTAAKNPHSARGTIACHFPRFRSLKAFGRRPRCKPHRRDRPASETLNKADSCTAAFSTPFDHLLGAREQRYRHFEGPSTYAASIRRRVQPLRRRLAQLRGVAILRGEETRCYELRGAHPAAW